MPWRERFKNRFVFSVAGVLALLSFVYVFDVDITALIPRSLADTNIIRPDAEGTTGGTAVGCTSGLYYECLNDAVTQPTNPSTGSDYLQLSNTQYNVSQLGTFGDIDTATAVTIWLYHSDANTNAFKTVQLLAADEVTSYGGPTTLTSQTSAGWTSVTYSGLTLTQAQVDGLRVRLDCEKSGGGKSYDCFTYALYADVTYDPFIEVTAGSTGTQQNLDTGATNAYIGGTFSIISNSGTRDVTGITIEENGTVNAQTNLDNIKLYYEYDTTAADGYNCSDQTYAGTETQFGLTDTDGFSGADGTSAFTMSVSPPSITTTQSLCVYVVLDVGSGALPGQTIEVEINDPTADLTFSDSPDIEPATTVTLAGTTIIQKQDLDQVHYHWRNDDGDKTDGVGGATSATGGTEDTTLDTMSKSGHIRLRMEVSNEGNKTSAATQYRLEYGQKITTCDAISGANWFDVGASGGDWDMHSTGNLTEGDDTTNIVESSGGVTDENASFLGTNAGIKVTSSQTSSITLTSTQFVEFEYSIAPTTGASEGNTYCFRLTNAGTPIDSYTVYPEATILADVTVSQSGTQRATVDIPTSDVYVGAKFIIADNITGNNTVDSITISAAGTVDLQNDIDNIELRYEYDTTGADGYNCSDQSYGGGESLYGTTDTDGFSVTGKSTFTGTATINPTQTMCLYVVYDVGSGATNGETLDIKIDNASTDVLIDTGTVAPTALVDLPGVTEFVTDTTKQVHYHWRNDNGNETGATSATGGTEDTPLENLRRTSPIRLRIGVANEGGSTTPAYQYRLEFALRTSVCAVATGWTDVGATNDEFNMYNSANITDGGNTTNIAVANGGVTNVGTTYLTTNGALKDTSSQTGNITLPGYNYVDLEYAITASTSATEGATYCFRVTNAGTPLDSYVNYPRVTIKPKTDFFVQRGITTVSGTSATINAGTNYIAPSSASRAFIRIVGTNHVGAGSPTNTGNADDVTVYISNPSNITSGITFTRPATAVDTTRVNWEIVEYVGAPGGDNEIVVRQQQTATYGAANTTVTSPTVSGIVDDNDVAVFITSQMNPDTAKNYPYGLSTSAWNAGTDDATFTRGASGNAAILSYAVIEFVGDNWKVQRASHTYTAAGTTETQSITSVNSMARTFLHTQKRMASGLNNHSDFGHNVYLSGIGQLSFELQASAGTPSSHTSVAWVIENTQTIGDTMRVSRSNGTESGGTAPKTVTNNIGVTISDKQDASLFINNYGNEANGSSNANTFPEPIIGAEIISSTQYQNWIAEPDFDSRTWRAEVVEWPTAARDIVQNYYRFYVNNDALDPTDPWPAGPTDLGENTEVTALDGPIANGSTTRIRMTLNITSASMDAGIDNFILQYGERPSAGTCTAIPETEWFPVGEIGSTTALWRGYDGTPADGTALSGDPPTPGDLNITSVADVAGTYEEENPSALVPYDVEPLEDVEYDWVVQHNGAKDKTSYCFRMLESDGTLFDDYLYYPVMRTVGFEPTLKTWRWYDDETNLTPSTHLGGYNEAPVDIANQNILKLRLTIEEVSGAPGVDAKFALQYSEYADFSQGVNMLTSTTSCTGGSLWCYADGAGVDNEAVDSAVIADADTCTGGVGAGCGTHNEGVSTTTATVDHTALATAEYEFIIKQDGARANAVYYFRLYDLKNNEVVGLGATSTYPSLVIEGAQLVSTLAGVASNTSMANIISDVDTTATSIGYGTLPYGSSLEAIQEIAVDTNATDGYQVYVYADGPLVNATSDEIAPISSTNAVPKGWTEACGNSPSGCFGYHTTDATLFGGSGRFGPLDSYAPLTTSPEEVAYSSFAVDDTVYMIYRLQIQINQPIGDYETSIVYLTTPVF